MFIGMIEGVPEIKHEDSGMAMIATVYLADDEHPSARDGGFFVRIQSYDDCPAGVEPVHLLEPLLTGKRVRVTIEVVDD